MQHRELFLWFLYGEIKRRNKMNKVRKISIILLMLSLLFLALNLFVLFTDFSTNIRVSEAGGAYAYSPNKYWKAEIWDGFCEDNGKNYAVIYLCDINKYPSLSKDTIQFMVVGKPEVKLVFPKDFYARDAKCDVNWINSDVFEIEFASEDGLQIFRYNIPDRTFIL